MKRKTMEVSYEPSVASEVQELRPPAFSAPPTTSDCNRPGLPRQNPRHLHRMSKHSQSRQLQCKQPRHISIASSSQSSTSSTHVDTIVTASSQLRHHIHSLSLIPRTILPRNGSRKHLRLNRRRLFRRKSTSLRQ